MQRIPFGLAWVVALYVSTYACATVAAPFINGLASTPNTLPSASNTVPAAEKPVPHIALLLPLKSATFGQAAEAVRGGFLAAAGSRPQGLPVKVYGCTDESKDIAALYQFAIESGARAVVGPLTRNGVATLSNNASITAPTLALNTAEARSAEKLYFYGLSGEAEARQVAQMAMAAKLSNAIIIHDGAPLSLRLAQAFSESWRAQGGSIAKEIEYGDDPAVLTKLPPALGNMVFLAADVEKAHLLRPYIDPSLPVYATSQMFNGNSDTLTNHDLKDVHFVDMPWLLQLDHPAVMVYPRATPSLEPDMERLYALGIDAYRLILLLLDGSAHAVTPLDGVTGRIQLGDDHRFQRTAVPAVFKQGLGLTPKAAAALRFAPKVAASGVPADPAPVMDEPIQ